MWIDIKTDIDGRWIGTIYYLIKQYGELYVYDILLRLVYPLGARLQRSESLQTRAEARTEAAQGTGSEGTGR